MDITDANLPGKKTRRDPDKFTGVSQEEQRKKERYYYASQSKLIWWRFRQHRLAMTSLPILGLFYLVAIFSDFIAPYSTVKDFPQYLHAPPLGVHFFSRDAGSLKFEGPFVYDIKGKMDINTLQRVYEEDLSKKHHIKFFTKGDDYKLWGLIRTNIHLFASDEGPVLLFGTDRLGRDLFSRIIHGSRISLSIGLVGVFISFILGLILGGISGFFGGLADNIIQRSIDLLMSIPRIPLWMTLAAALPRDWSSINTYFAITLILSTMGWTGLARVIRGKLLSLREEDFTVAAKVAGASDARIISKHLLPLFFSYIVVSLTISIPQMILSETALSFLGLGIQPPAVSWGTLLKDAQKIASVALQPWLLIPTIFVIITVLVFNFVGDGLRDAADPYSTR